MADNILYEGRVLEKRGRWAGRLPGLIIGLVLAVLAGQGVFHLLLAPKLRISRIIVEGELPLDRGRLLSIAGLEGRPQFVAVREETVRRNLEAWPGIKSAVVEKSFPDSLRIRAQARRPLAVAFAETGKGTLPLAFDEEGVVFSIGAAAADPALPVLSGIRFEGVRAGVRLPGMLEGLLRDLHALRTGAPAVFGSFSELRIVRKGEEAFEILLYPVHFRTPIRMEGALTEERCKMALMVLDVMSRENLLDKLEEIDFRTGDIIYRIRKEG